MQVTSELGEYRLEMLERVLCVKGTLVGEHDLDAMLGDIRVRGTVVGVENALNVWLHDESHTLHVYDALSAVGTYQAHGGDLVSPMPGRVTRVTVKEGVDVTRGASLMVLEAMKMEHRITAPSAGRVEKLNFAVGDWVEEGSVLLDFVPVE